jgi:hypothetical protein
MIALIGRHLVGRSRAFLHPVFQRGQHVASGFELLKEEAPMAESRDQSKAGTYSRCARGYSRARFHDRTPGRRYSALIFTVVRFSVLDHPGWTQPR